MGDGEWEEREKGDDENHCMQISGICWDALRCRRTSQARPSNQRRRKVNMEQR